MTRLRLRRDDNHISDRDLAHELAGEAREDRTRARLTWIERQTEPHSASCECHRCTLDRDWRLDRDRRLDQ